MSETVKRWDATGVDCDMAELTEGDYVLYSDYAALSKRLAETEAIAKSLLDKAPAQADEMRRMGAQVVELTKALQSALDVTRCMTGLRFENGDLMSAEAQMSVASALEAELEAALSAKPHAGQSCPNKCKNGYYLSEAIFDGYTIPPIRCTWEGHAEASDKKY